MSKRDKEEKDEPELSKVTTPPKNKSKSGTPEYQKKHTSPPQEAIATSDTIVVVATPVRKKTKPVSMALEDGNEDSTDEILRELGGERNRFVAKTNEPIKQSQSVPPQTPPPGLYPSSWSRRIRSPKTTDATPEKKKPKKAAAKKTKKKATPKKE